MDSLFKASLKRRWGVSLALNVVSESRFVSDELLKRAAGEVFLFVGFDFDVNLSFVTDQEMKELNHEFRDKEELTSVLSFNHEEGTPHGDIAISETVVASESNNLNYPEQELIILYLVHGMLHLAGLDHTKDEERDKMEKTEEEILAKLGIDIKR
jgi:probable rRNA maturation factor